MRSFLKKNWISIFRIAAIYCGLVAILTISQRRSLHCKRFIRVYGRVIYKNAEEIAVAQNPFNLGDVTKAPIGKVKEVAPSQVSMMPPATIFTMNKDELMDLLAYLISSGNKKHKVFTKQSK